MRAGIIAEGKSDLAVITNILKGVLDIDKSDIQYLVPELEFDETDLPRMREEQFSNWTIVKNKCITGTVVSDFFGMIEDNRFLVIHIDTAERFEVNYDVPSPPKTSAGNYVEDTTLAVTDKIKEWLGDNLNDRITFAVAVEEIDAWLLTLFEETEETGHYPNPKRRFDKLFNDKFSKNERRKISQLEVFKQYIEKSKLFRKHKNMEQFCERNRSLSIFVERLKSFEVE